MRLGLTELILIFALVLLIIGPMQLPKLTKTIKEAIKDFKSNDEETKETDVDEK